MFNWFRKKEQPVRSFPDNQSAFAHACTMGYRPLLGALLPALVEEEGRRGSEGERFFRLRLAAPAGGRELWAGTIAGAPAFPEKGDLVAFRVVRIATELPEDASLIGFVACKLEPVLEGSKGWRIATSYTPPNLKPELHL